MQARIEDDCNEKKSSTSIFNQYTTSVWLWSFVIKENQKCPFLAKTSNKEAYLKVAPVSTSIVNLTLLSDF